MICPNMTTPKWPLVALVPAYRIQLPTRTRTLAAMMAAFGPPLLRVHMTTLVHVSGGSGQEARGRSLRANEDEGE